MEDDDIDTSENPKLDDDFFERARWRSPARQVDVTLRIDANILEWFQAQGDDYETRVNAALRLYAQAHKS